MNRLLEGDVGSGKTVVAAIAILNALTAGVSVALLAPTEILAQQHFATFRDWFRNMPWTVAVRTSAFRAVATRGAQHPHRRLRPSVSRLTIGTHALLEDGVDLGNVGLVIVDEQHRFGVAQRSALRSRGLGRTPHFLSLTATPIPRSLALSLAGDLKLSTLRTLPKGRKPIDSKLLGPHERDLAYRFAEKTMESGRQVFCIAPLIEPSDALGIASATSLFEEVRSRFPHRRIGLLHGKLPSVQKNDVLRAFARHELDALVATPVVEVGIDVPNATVLICEGAERFGLAQLHQLRGRIGRGEHRSTCFFLARTETPLARRRLAAVASTTDGFRLAELDLELRGPGDLAGTLQSGFLDFRFATLGDHALMLRARAMAETILDRDPNLARHQPLKHLLFRPSNHRE
jgi:ATP-dependent DNA helicase RecG